MLSSLSPRVYPRVGSLSCQHRWPCFAILVPSFTAGQRLQAIIVYFRPCSKSGLIYLNLKKHMTLNQIYWIVSFAGLILTFLIVWFIVERLNRFGFDAYKWVIYILLLLYAGKEIFRLAKNGNLDVSNPFFWFWAILGIVSAYLLVKSWRPRKKKGVTEE